MYLNAIQRGDKTFELRVNDCDFIVGEEVILREWDFAQYTGRAVRVKITYLLDLSDFIKDDRPWVVFSIRVLWFYSNYNSANMN